MSAFFPDTITYDGKKLFEMAEAADLSSLLLMNFRAKADRILTCERISVVDRRLKAFSGDPHDYMSMGPYWWPNPDTPDGFPYIRRDGEINPETRDEVNYSRLCDSVHTLALAALYFKDKRYADKAVRMLRDWHVEPETRMNPHLEYGQSIPGVCNGRGIGLIDFSGSYNVFNGVAILEFLGWIDEETLVELKKWYVEFVNWMLTSENGADEDFQHNNHGAWFDVQVAAAALFTGRRSLARKTLNAAYIRRHAMHIKADGSQPHELARTKGIHYSFYNLDALTLLGNMGVKQGIKQPYWQNDGEVGDLLRL
ncbi:MAG: alginate lyase family protein, partial [Clostridia bacterium]|nr:alginate lyase family protein [Clostridia bacterium]